MPFCICKLVIPPYFNPRVPLAMHRVSWAQSHGIAFADEGWLIKYSYFPYKIKVNIYFNAVSLGGTPSLNCHHMFLSGTATGDLLYKVVFAFIHWWCSQIICWYLKVNILNMHMEMEICFCMDIDEYHIYLIIYTYLYCACYSIYFYMYVCMLILIIVP